MAEDLSLLFQNEGMAKVHLVGHSMYVSFTFSLLETMGHT